MTKITFYKKGNLFSGFEVTGHTGKEEKGKDLLCAQISTVAQLALVGGEEGKTDAFYQVSDGYLKIIFPEKDINKPEIQFLLRTCKKSFESIIIGEEKFAKLEVKNV